MIPSLLKENAQYPSALSDRVAKVMQACPDDRSLLMLGMYSSYRSGDLSIAATYYERLVNAKSASVELHADAGYIYTKLGKRAQALHAFELAVEGGADAFIQFELAQSLHRASRNREAILVLEKVIKENPPEPPKDGVTVIGEDAVYDEANALLNLIRREAQPAR